MLNVRSSDPYWLSNTGILPFTSLKQDITTDVAVIGAGISGALAAYQLLKAGCKVSIITNGQVGVSSTCASTSLLQYEIDVPLRKLIKMVGEESAERSYLLCHDSIDQLEATHKIVGASASFQNKKSLLLASRIKDVEGLEKEFKAREKIGIKMKWLAANQIEVTFGFAAPAAIYSARAAQTDAYLFTQKLIQWCVAHGAQVYNKTEIAGMQHGKRSVKLTTTGGNTIAAKHVVMATGYEAVKWVDLNIARLHSTYVIISEPVDEQLLWKDKCLIWETARPYIYMRTTKDNRIIAGGKDEPFNSAHKRDALIPYKNKQLLKAVHSKFPNINFTIEHSWAGTFGETRDGLPFIGTTKKLPRVHFALGYGGNGITFSQIAANIISDAITGKHNPDRNRFSFDRINYK